MNLQLLVLRTSDPERLAEFYNLLGLTFEYHKHGNSPYHYSGLLGEATLEIYPLSKNQIEVDKNLRLGFGIDNFEAVIERLKESHIKFSSEPTQTEFGFMALIVDPDGRKVELYKR